MKDLQAAPDAAAVGDLGHDVLSNPLLFSHLWGLLNRDGKRALRGVLRRLVELSDAAVEALDMREEGMSEGDTSALALAKCSITSLTAVADEDSLRVICAAPLAKLRKLVLYVEDDGSREEMDNVGWLFIDDANAVSWSVPVLSRTAAAGLQELHLINANHYHHEVSIQAVSSCVNLRKLNVEDNNISSDPSSDRTPLAALAAPTQLRELTLQVGQLWDLAPLKGCAQLAKLWILLEDTDLTQLQDFAQLTDLDISYSDDLSFEDDRVQLLSLDGLEAWSQMCRLNMQYAAVSSLAPLAACSLLEDLNMNCCKHVSSLTPLCACALLKELNISSFPLVSSLEPLSACPLLEVINMSGCELVTSLALLSACTLLKDLNISTCNLEGGLVTLSSCVQLQVLSLSCTSVTSLEPLSACVALQNLNLYYCTAASSLAPLSSCTLLKKLIISLSTAVSSLVPLSVCVQLEDLYLYSCTAVSSLGPLSLCSKLQTLNVSSCELVSSLEPLSACTLLEKLWMSSCKLVNSLEPLSACAVLKEVYMSKCNTALSVAPLQACALLEVLSIRRDSNPPGLAATKAALPRLRIYHW